MKILNNERGGALLLVLLMIILMTMFTMFQMKQIVTTKQQIAIAEKEIDARNIVNMGITSFRREVEVIVESFPENVIEQRIKDRVSLEPIELDPNHTFKNEFLKYDPHIKDQSAVPEDKLLGTVYFRSTGTAFDRTIVEEKSIEIRNN